MKNRLLAHVTVTCQHSGGGTMLAGAYVTRQHKCTILVGDIRHPPAQMEAFVLAGAFMSPASTVPLQNQQSLFKVVKRCQIKKL
jgi:DUF917 family protein